MINAYVLVVVNPGFSNKAVNEINKIDEAIKTSVIAGDYDIIVRVSVNGLDQLHKVTNMIQKINGIKKTVTSVIAKELTL
jgi:DNA-binding Lrp family transcriptional regulator